MLNFRDLAGVKESRAVPDLDVVILVVRCFVEAVAVPVTFFLLAVVVFVFVVFEAFADVTVVVALFFWDFVVVRLFRTPFFTGMSPLTASADFLLLLFAVVLLFFGGI